MTEYRFAFKYINDFLIPANKQKSQFILVKYYSNIISINFEEVTLVDYDYQSQ